MIITSSRAVKGYIAFLATLIILALFALPALGAPAPTTTSPAVTLGLPASIDLSAYDPPVLNQGTTGACAAFAASYLRGWDAAKAGNLPIGGFAPLSIYSRVAALYDNHHDTGATISQILSILHTYGIAPAASYPLNLRTWNVLPTAAQAKTALAYRIGAYHLIWPPVTLTPRSMGIDSALLTLADGRPVLLSFYILPTFYTPQGSLFGGAATSTLIDNSTSIPAVLTSHTVMADGYDANGIWFINSWGDAYGVHGRAELSWAYLQNTILGVGTDA